MIFYLALDFPELERFLESSNILDNEGRMCEVGVSACEASEVGGSSVSRDASSVLEDICAIGRAVSRIFAPVIKTPMKDSRHELLVVAQKQRFPPVG